MLLLLLAGAGGWWRFTTAATLQAAEAELRTTVEQKPEMGATPDGDALAATIKDEWTSADEPIAPLDAAMQTFEIVGDQAMARIVMQDQRGQPVYRQTRFYRHIANSWQPTPPDAILWGAARTLETPYFVYYVGEKDAAAVQAVAPQMDTLYTTLWQNFGLPISRTSEKLVIDVSVAQPPGQATVFDATRHISVASPARYRAPIDLTDAELLAQSLALPLVTYGVAQARTAYALIASWQPLLDGLYLWQVWDTDLPLSSWRAEMLQWLYIDLPTSQPEQPIVLPVHYEMLCRVLQLWLHLPMQFNLPLWCTDLNRTAWHSIFGGADAPPVRLAQLGIPVPGEVYSDPTGEPLLSNHPGQTVALATLIDYVVATYGRERLPALVAALGHYDRWETLVPAVYGVSAAEFEAGWQAYLTAHYGIAVMLPSNP